MLGIRDWLLCSYSFGADLYNFRGRNRHYPSPVHWIREVGCLVYYGITHSHTGRKKKKMIADMDAFVAQWKHAVVLLAVAHDKDEADRAEASVDGLLTPLLTAPVRQLREFAPKLLEALRSDGTVPYLVWRAYEIWLEEIKTAPDQDVIELKTDLAREIAQMVETDVQPQLVDAMTRALCWRSPAQLEKVKAVVEREQKAGNKTRLKGRESCLFLEAGGTEADPEILIQV